MASLDDEEAEKRAWEAKANENGLRLAGMDLTDADDMKELFEMLEVRGIAAKSRLRSHIRGIQQEGTTNQTPRKRRRSRLGHTLGSPTPGRRSDDSRKAAQSFLDEVLKTGFEVRINGDPMLPLTDERLMESKFRDCPMALENDVAVYLGVQFHMTPTEKHPDLEVDIKAGLVQHGEKKFQTSQEFRSGMLNVAAAHALDNSDSSAVGPFYKPAQKISGVGDAVYEKTAKIDVTSTVAPMDLEMKGTKDDPQHLTGMVKNDWWVLKQAAERTRVRLFLAGYLSLTVAFAVTNRHAWCVIGRRYFAGGDVRVDISFWRIPHVSITRLWMGVTRRAETCQNFFITEDGWILCHALCKVGVAPWSCRVNILGISQSVVYGVSLPGTLNSSSSSLCINASKIDYAVKVMRSDWENYSREVESLKAIAKVDPSFYAIGYVDRGGEAVRFDSSSRWKTGATVPSPEVEGEYRWWSSLLETDGSDEGGAIFMKYGYAKKVRDDDMSDVWLGVSESLRFAHLAGILHCDIRESNLLFFDDVGWRLVDFGLSCKNDGNPYDLKSDSGEQANGVGPRVKKCLTENQSFHWTIGDDYEMLMQMFRVYG